jgi:hypothetical protein
MDVEGIKYFTKPMLKELNDNARLSGAINYINPLLFEEYDDETCLPIDYFEFHGEVVTAAVFLNPEGDVGFLDIPARFFESIPTYCARDSLPYSTPAEVVPAVLH